MAVSALPTAAIVSLVMVSAAVLPAAFMAEPVDSMGAAADTAASFTLALAKSAGCIDAHYLRHSLRDGDGFGFLVGIMSGACQCDTPLVTLTEILVSMGWACKLHENARAGGEASFATNLTAKILGGQKDMKSIFAMAVAVLAIGITGCSTTSTKSPDVSDNIHKALTDAGLKDVSVKQDREKGVVTLGGHVAADADRARAESIAKSIAGNQVVADEVAVTPPGAESDAKTVNSDLDKGIAKNLDAALVQNRLKKNVHYDVKNGVVTLKGSVISEARRSQVENIANSVPNVRQVVNELEVKNRKATASR